MIQIAALYRQSGSDVGASIVDNRVDPVILESSAGADAHFRDRDSIQRFDWVEVDSTK